MGENDSNTGLWVLLIVFLLMYAFFVGSGIFLFASGVIDDVLSLRLNNSR